MTKIYVKLNIKILGFEMKKKRKKKEKQKKKKKNIKLISKK